MIFREIVFDVIVDDDAGNKKPKTDCSGGNYGNDDIGQSFTHTLNIPQVFSYFNVKQQFNLLTPYR
jgi:hypothetical protein